MKGIKLVTLWVLAFVVSLMSVAAQPVITLDEIELDDTNLQATGNNVLALDKGQDVELEVSFHSDQDIDDMQIEAAIRGYDHDDLIQDITSSFNVKANTTYTKRLTLPLRERMDQDRYQLKLRFETRTATIDSSVFDLEIEAERHKVIIRDVIVNPENEVKAGRALLTSVRVENRGQKDEKDIKVQVSIPTLGVSATSFIDEVEKEDDDDDRKTSEEMFLRIPSDAATGTYMLRTVVTYDEGDEQVTQEVPINVIGEEVTAVPEAAAASKKTVIGLASNVESAQAGGAETVFPITLTNSGSASKVYTVSVDGANWGTFRVAPSNVVVVEAGESKAVNVYAAPNADAQAGAQTFLLTVQSEGKVLKQIPLQVNVAEAENQSSTLRKVLEVGLIVLLILVVVIGLILAFTRRNNDDEDNEEEQSYY